MKQFARVTLNEDGTFTVPEFPRLRWPPWPVMFLCPRCRRQFVDPMDAQACYEQHGASIPPTNEDR